MPKTLRLTDKYDAKEEIMYSLIIAFDDATTTNEWNVF